MLLKDLKKENVFKYFFEISIIPRGSRNTQKISEYIVDFAKNKNLVYRCDEIGNVIIFKPATSGLENNPKVMFQAHLDMVAEKKPESKHDFLNDPLALEINGDFLFAKDTTLGADDGVGVAIMLAVLEDESIKHPALEAVFTIDEEIGMIGANALDCSALKSKYLINLDSEKEGEICVGCAGGASVKCTFNIEKEEFSKEMIEFSLSGFIGGHSGTTIHENKANAINVSGRILNALRQVFDINIISVVGGTKDNAITRDATVCFLFEGDSNKVISVINNTFNTIKNEYRMVEKKLKIEVKCSYKENVFALTSTLTENILDFLLLIPYGVINMSTSIEGLVETSANQGITDISTDNILCVISVRSSVKSRKEHVVSKIKTIVKNLNGNVVVEGDYPEWDFNEASTLTKEYRKHFIAISGYEPKVIAIHAGLECGYLLSKMPGLDIISVGPEIYSIHTTEEKLSISSTLRIYEIVKEVLKTLQ